MFSRLAHFYRIYQKKILATVPVILFLCAPVGAHAASISIAPSASSVSVGNIVTVNVMVNTMGDPINNAEATIQFPTEFLEVVSVNKNSSIFSLWVEDPNFSNYTGKVSFNGGIATPGYTGANGLMATITFKAKKVGTASLIFTEGAVRKNDGLGTNILTIKNTGTIKINEIIKETPPVEQVPQVITEKEAPVIISKTHPDKNTWYPNALATFNWKIPTSATTIQTLYNKLPNSIPTLSYDSSVTEKKITNIISDGTFYFHLRYLDGGKWSPVAHYVFNIDKTIPELFTPSIRSEDNRNFIMLDAQDVTSGIDYYTITIGSNSPITVPTTELVNKEYVLPPLNAGTQSISVLAYDKAGNFRKSDVTFTSTFVFKSPQLSISPQMIYQGGSVTISGKTDYLDSQVETTLVFEGTVIGTYTAPIAPDGSFSIEIDALETIGTIDISAVNLFPGGIKSAPSETLQLIVEKKKSLLSMLPISWLLLSNLLLLTILIIISFVGWYKYYQLKKKAEKYSHDPVESVHRSITLLKKELDKQFKILEKVESEGRFTQQEGILLQEIKKKKEILLAEIESNEGFFLNEIIKRQ